MVRVQITHPQIESRVWYYLYSTLYLQPSQLTNKYHKSKCIDRLAVLGLY